MASSTCFTNNAVKEGTLNSVYLILFCVVLQIEVQSCFLLEIRIVKVSKKPFFGFSYTFDLSGYINSPNIKDVM